jgi:AraC-like DNA-binding protein
MKIFVKHMISTPCKMFVKEELNKLGIRYNSIELGEIDVLGNLTMVQREKLGSSLNKYGFELMVDRRTILVEKIKSIITELIHYTDERISTKYSYILSERLGFNYNYLAGIFSEDQGITIEKYIILHKIERIKELMMYGELNMTGIAWKLNYSSVAHLSFQFKKVTGLTPSQFRQLNGNRRMSVEEISPSKNIYTLSVN